MCPTSENETLSKAREQSCTSSKLQPLLQAPAWERWLEVQVMGKFFCFLPLTPLSLTLQSQVFIFFYQYNCQSVTSEFFSASWKSFPFFFPFPPVADLPVTGRNRDDDQMAPVFFSLDLKTVQKEYT